MTGSQGPTGATGPTGASQPTGDGGVSEAGATTPSGVVWKDATGKALEVVSSTDSQLLIIDPATGAVWNAVILTGVISPVLPHLQGFFFPTSDCSGPSYVQTGGQPPNYTFTVESSSIVYIAANDVQPSFPVFGSQQENAGSVCVSNNGGLFSTTFPTIPDSALTALSTSFALHAPRASRVRTVTSIGAPASTGKLLDTFESKRAR